ncbi:hypothetical protein DSO57_1030210 [Entomophthora muscae]|uniref:Uncharacterized protein n=1 Tax=Entomophthora muscae TaxID=34485 RepID=A0ACC2TN91_9FUNG|nr:hypothetical protein DSO57_1030210 [Entomophthora muscae]
MNPLVLFTTALLNIQLLSAASSGGAGVKASNKGRYREKTETGDINQLGSYNINQGHGENSANESNTGIRYPHQTKQPGEKRKPFGADEDV